MGVQEGFPWAGIPSGREGRGRGARSNARAVFPPTSRAAEGRRLLEAPAETCSSSGWGPLCGRNQYLLQLGKGGPHSGRGDLWLGGGRPANHAFTLWMGHRT